MFTSFYVKTVYSRNGGSVTKKFYDRDQAYAWSQSQIDPVWTDLVTMYFYHGEQPGFTLNEWRQ